MDFLSLGLNCCGSLGFQVCLRDNNKEVVGVNMPMNFNQKIKEGQERIFLHTDFVLLNRFVLRIKLSKIGLNVVVKTYQVGLEQDNMLSEVGHDKSVEVNFLSCIGFRVV